MKKRIVEIIAILLVGVMLTACGDIKSKLAGHWVARPSRDSGSFYNYYDFFSDGTYSSYSDNYHGSYSVDGNRIRLSGVLVSDKVVEYKFEGDTLVIDGMVYYKE